MRFALRFALFPARGLPATRLALAAPLLALLYLPAAHGADDLLQVYRDAQANDAQFASARAQLAASQEKLPQGRAGLLPQIAGAVGASRTKVDQSAPVVGDRFLNGNNWALQLTQPLFRWDRWETYKQGELAALAGEVSFSQAQLDLITRTSQAYFDVLASQDNLYLAGAQKKAIAEQLAQAKRNFEVGTATITDTHEAQARFDLAAAQEIAAQNDLDAKKRALQQLTGKEYVTLRPLRADVKLAPPEPNRMDDWVGLAEKQSYPVQIQELASEIAQLEVRRNAAGHHPTLDLVASYGWTSQTSSQLTAVGSNVGTGTLGLQFGLPLYAGGAISSREREAAANFEKSRQDLENARRSAALATRQSYLAVINGIAQVGALEQALVSSQSALDSNKLGYEVGVRINIDVLNAQQQLFSTRRDLALARYNTITNHLRLKSAAGSLREEDVELVSRALVP